MGSIQIPRSEMSTSKSVGMFFEQIATLVKSISLCTSLASKSAIVSSSSNTFFKSSEVSFSVEQTSTVIVSPKVLLKTLFSSPLTAPANSGN